MYVLVVPFDRSFDDIGLTYIVPDFLKESVFLGALVLVPFGNNIIKAVIIDIQTENSKTDLQYKPIISVLFEQAFLYKYQINLIKWMADFYFILIHQVMYSFFPKNLIEKIDKETLKFEEKKDLKYEFNTKKILTNSQKEAFLKIENTTKNLIYLFGVTGSGKTEIYVNLVKKYIDEQKQVLILVPEIILSSQLANYMQDVFGKEVILLNSSVSEALKTKYRLSIYNSNAKIIIGTRSALFYPYKDLGLIIVDEEHDNSYISDSNPRFNSIDVVGKISEELGIKRVFASGTPSVNHFYKALKTNYEIVNLFEEISSF